MQLTSELSDLLKTHYIVVNVKPLLILTRNGSLFLNMMSVETPSSVRDSRIYQGISTYLVMNLDGLRLTNFPFNEVTLGPKISLSLFRSCKVTGELDIMFGCTMFDMYLYKGKISSFIARCASQAPLCYRRVNPYQFSVTVFRSNTLFYLSMASN